MSMHLIEKSIIPLLVATLLVGMFYWQFISIYPFLIERFTTEKLSMMYAHLIIYTFLALTLFTSLTNILNYFILKSKAFVGITIMVLLIFYILSYNVFNDLFQYFFKLPLSENGIMGLILFIVSTVGYSLYSLIILLFNKFIPIVHILVFTLIGITYSALFIDSYCYPITEVFTKF